VNAGTNRRGKYDWKCRTGVSHGEEAKPRKAGHGARAALSKFTASLQEQAATTQPNTDQAIQLRKRLSSCETALRLNDTLNASR
jgi:hypothetical protein